MHNISLTFGPRAGRRRRAQFGTFGSVPALTSSARLRVNARPRDLPPIVLSHVQEALHARGVVGGHLLRFEAWWSAAENR